MGPLGIKGRPAEHVVGEYLRCAEGSAVFARNHERHELAIRQFVRFPFFDIARPEEHEMLEPGTDGVLAEGVEVLVLAAAGIVDEDELRLEGDLGKRIVVLEHDLVGAAGAIPRRRGRVGTRRSAAAKGDAEQFPERG